MKLIVAKVSVILSTIFIVISICGISSVDCLKGLVSMQETIINKDSVIHGLTNGDMNLLPYNLIPLFYISLLLILLSSTISFTKRNKIISSITIAISVIPIIYVLITHNYIFFLILLNIYLFLYIIFNCFRKDKMGIFVIVFAIAICLINIIKLFKHLNLDFSSDAEFEVTLIYISKINLICLLCWFIPYGILLVKEVKESNGKEM